jgi:cupin 2 domain-containing protein
MSLPDPAGACHYPERALEGDFPMAMPGNMFADISPKGADEELTELLRTPAVRIERIVSHGHASPPGFWYDQYSAEWVLLLGGAAILAFEGDPEPVRLEPGDYVLIPAHARHRVEWSDPDRPTIWLAVHYG